jgi:uncharacterized NAD(P)/FAD-binding protein YdhS
LPAAAQLADSYVSRRHYGDYLQLRLQQASARSSAQLVVIHDRVLALHKHADHLSLQLQDTASVQAGALVLAVGQAPRPLPLPSATALPDGCCRHGVARRLLP